MYRVTPTRYYGNPYVLIYGFINQLICNYPFNTFNLRVTSRSIDPVVITKQPLKYIEREWSHDICSCCDNVSEC